MQNEFELKQTATVHKGRSGRVSLGSKTPSVRSGFKPRGFFTAEHWRNGLLLATNRFPNGIVNEGKDSIFDVYFDAATQITVWYMGLIDLVGFSALASDDTYDDIDQAGNGWDEFPTYTDAGNGDSTVTRPVWNPDPASGQSITNGSQVIFDITGTATVKGLFISGGGAANATKGDHASDGTLWSTALFDQGDTAVVSGDQLKITYTVSA